MDAVDDSGDLTELGSHMCDLPLPPKYSKMVLVSIALKCVDPILTIACILASENPCVFNLFVFLFFLLFKNSSTRQLLQVSRQFCRYYVIIRHLIFY